MLSLFTCAVLYIYSPFLCIQSLFIYTVYICCPCSVPCGLCSGLLTNPHLWWLQVLSEAQDEPGSCAFYEECGRNPLLEGTGTLVEPIVPCLNYTRPPLLSGEHYRKLKQVCCSNLHVHGEHHSFVVLKGLRAILASACPLLN